MLQGKRQSSKNWHCGLYTIPKVAESVAICPERKLTPIFLCHHKTHKQEQTTWALVKRGVIAGFKTHQHSLWLYRRKQQQLGYQSYFLVRASHFGCALSICIGRNPNKQDQTTPILYGPSSEKVNLSVLVSLGSTQKCPHVTSASLSLAPICSQNISIMIMGIETCWYKPLKQLRIGTWIKKSKMLAIFQQQKTRTHMVWMWVCGWLVTHSQAGIEDENVGPCQTIHNRWFNWEVSPPFSSNN